MDITERIKKFLAEMGVPMTKFAAKFGKSRQTFYVWLKGSYAPSKQTQQAVDQYLKQYGF